MAKILYESLITEDGEPVDIFAGVQQRLLAGLLYEFDHIPEPFLAAANVGIFDNPNRPAIAPDMFLSLSVEPGDDLMEKENRSYFMWKYGKPPEIVVESVSNKKGNEAGSKLERYAAMGVKYYVILDHGHYIQNETLIVYELQGDEYVARRDYRLPDLNLSLTIWEGEFEKIDWPWIRWCTLEGEILLTGKERAEQAEALAALYLQKLREAGIKLDD